MSICSTCSGVGKQGLLSRNHGHLGGQATITPQGGMVRNITGDFAVLTTVSIQTSPQGAMVRNITGDCFILSKALMKVMGNLLMNQLPTGSR